MKSEHEKVTTNSSDRHSNHSLSTTDEESNHKHGHQHKHHKHNHGTHDHSSHHESLESKDTKQKRNLNVEAARLHILGDMLNSIGVIIAATIILFFPNLWYFDPLCTYFFSIIVFYTTWQTFVVCVKTFLEGSPEEFDYDEVRGSLRKIKGVQSVHDLHIWSIS